MPQPQYLPGSTERQLLDALPREFVVALVQIFKQVYRDVLLSLGTNLRGSRRNSVAGMSRWAFIEEEILKLKGRFPSVEIVEVPGEGGHRHIEIRAKRFVFTVAYSRDRKKMARPARYRKGLASRYQLRLDPEFFDAQTQEPVGPEFYGIISHGPARTPTGYDYMHVSFTAMTFPTRDYSGYARDSVDLLTLFNVPLTTDAPAPIAEVPDEAKPRLRPGLGGATGTENDRE